MLASSSSPPTALWRVSFTVSHWSQLGVILDDPPPQKLPRATGNHGKRLYKVFYFWQFLNTKLHSTRPASNNIISSKKGKKYIRVRFSSTRNYAYAIAGYNLTSQDSRRSHLNRCSLLFIHKCMLCTDRGQG